MSEKFLDLLERETEVAGEVYYLEFFDVLDRELAIAILASGNFFEQALLFVKANCFGGETG